MEDQRFKNITQDPRCRRIPKNVRKVKIDKRFKKLLKNKQFKESGKIDERGRTLKLTSSENLKKLYNFRDSSEEDEISENELKESEDGKPSISTTEQKISAKIKKHKIEPGNDSNGEKNVSHNKESKQIMKKKIPDQKLSSSISECTNIDDESNEEKDNLTGDSDNELNCSQNQLKKKVAQRLKSEAQNEKASIEFSNEESSGESEEKSDVSDSEDSDDSDFEEDSSVVEDEHDFYERHEKAPDTEQIYRRLAVCDMDWDRIQADDLYTVFNSYKPDGGSILSVKVYPSEYGLKRMEEERLKGPAELVEKTLDPDEEEVEDKKTSKYHMEKLREYQFNRLMYYYAVVDCDCPETADHLYENLNRKEYESCGLPFDLRFIPDEVTFDHKPVSEACKVEDPSAYKPRLFVNSAAQQSKVNLTWDETDPRRREILEKAFTEPESVEKDVKNYLASTSEESEEEQEDNQKEGKALKFSEQIAKYKELLKSLEEKNEKQEEKYEMEISWEPGLKEKTEKLVKQKLQDTGNPFDEMLKKKKEERKLKKQGKKMEVQQDEESKSEEGEDSDFFSEGKPGEKNSTKELNELYLISDAKKPVVQPEEKSSKKKRKKKKPKNKTEETHDLKFVGDDRFSALFTSHEYNIDPSNPHFKKTDGTLAIIQEKQKRFKNKEPPSNERSKNKKAKYS